MTLSHKSFGGLRRQRMFFRAAFSLILLRKINEKAALKKFYSAAEGGRTLMRQPHLKLSFAAEGGERLFDSLIQNFFSPPRAAKAIYTTHIKH